MTMTRRQWQDAIEKDLLDFDVRLVFADWLGEQGYEEEAEFQRWMCDEHIRAYNSYMIDRRKPVRGMWDWFSDSNTTDPIGRQFGDLPLVYYKSLPTIPVPAYEGGVTEYRTRLLAEYALFGAWKRVKQGEKTLFRDLGHPVKEKE